MCNVISLMHAYGWGSGYRQDRMHGEIRAGCSGWKGDVWGWAASVAPRYPHSHIICKISWLWRRGSSWVPRECLLRRHFPCLLHASTMPVAAWPCCTASWVLQALHPPSLPASFTSHRGHPPWGRRAPAPLPHPRAHSQGTQQLTLPEECLAKRNTSWS